MKPKGVRGKGEAGDVDGKGEKPRAGSMKTGFRFRGHGFYSSSLSALSM